MAKTYTKLFQTILDSTIWQESKETRLVWITMMAMTDRDGCVWASVPGLADRAKVGLKECEAAIKLFKAPDPYSRTKDNEGRRIREIDGGWQLLNHGKYRDMMGERDRREYQRHKQAEYRKRRRQVKRDAEVDGASAAVKDGLVDLHGG